MLVRKRAGVASLLMAVSLLVVTASTAAAAAPQDIHIEVHEIIATSGETFYASGPAVGSGLVCETGSVDDVSIVASGAQGGPFTILHVLKRFKCAGSTDSFDVALVVRLNTTTSFTDASWRVVGGTGPYSGLHGSGTLVGTPDIAGDSIDDVYDGRVN